MCSTQILGELYHTLTRKKLLTEEKAKEVIHETIETFSVTGIEPSQIKKAIAIHEQYKYSYWDSQVIASALHLEAEKLYSEDMQHNQVIRNSLRIINPFCGD